jgi:ADP-ribose pyrophosphatase YjhB (NUDIX family)
MKGMDRCEHEDLADSGMPEMAGLPLRLAGRVVVLDPGRRVLLLRYDDDSPVGRHWATPGGGLNPGESYAAAASRELAEETGWGDVVLRGEIHRHVRMVEHGGRIVRQHECLFLARTDRARRELGDVAAMHASDGIAAWRWWTLAELDTTAEVVWPAGLAGLIRGCAGSPLDRPAPCPASATPATAQLARDSYRGP